MKKYIVLSVNDNQDYLYFTPLVCWAWRHFGWEPILLYQGKVNDLTALIQDTFDNLHSDMTAEMKGLYKLKAHIVDPIDGYRSDTITQISRLYGCLTIKHGNDFVMTGDIDMLPLSDYWKVPDPLPIPGPTLDPIVWGHDLTGFGHYPICYIGMQVSKWEVVMKLMHENDINQAIKIDLDNIPEAKDPDFYKYWYTDQNLITKRLNEYGKDKITFINRGQGSHGFARGRVDRGQGGWVLNQPELIDCHMEQQVHHKKEKVDRLFRLLYSVWPKENFNWFLEYTEQYRKLTGHTG